MKYQQIMKEEIITNQDHAQEPSENRQSLIVSPVSTNQHFFEQLKYTLKALLYKSYRLQSKHYCSNICQIISPLLCLLFTLAVRQIVKGITTGAVQTFPYPQLLNLPILSNIVNPSLNLSCQEVYYYENYQSNQDSLFIHQVIDLQLQTFCKQTSSKVPIFLQKNSVNNAVINQLNIANKEAFERGNDLLTQIPDGIMKFKHAKKTNLDVCLAVNDFRLAEYHKNNGITKIVVRKSATTVISTYLRVTEGMMNMIEKITRSYLQALNSKEIISGSIMYMPFSGEDKSLINKTINVLGSGLYPLGLSLLLPLFLYMIVSEKEEKLIEMMKMNGLNIKIYWVNFFITGFIIEMVTFMLFYIFGTFVFEIQFFTKTSASVIWVFLILWGIAQLSLTTFIQIFINSAKSGAIVGYLVSIFSTLIGLTLSTAVYPSPMAMPTTILLYPPFALARSIYHIGYACAESFQCYRSIFDINFQLQKCLIILFCWSFVFILSIWLNEIIQQEYGVVKRPKLIQQCLRLTKLKQKNQRLIEQNDIIVELSDLKSESNGPSSVSLKEEVDISVRQQKKLALNSQISRFPFIIKQISKTYDIDNGQKRNALKQFSLTIRKNQIFGLLGPNGAGKTTLISVLTGMYPQTSGQAWIKSKQIGSSQTNKLIGLCPQFDLLWPDLTVEEHLVFYAKLKQIKDSDLIQKVNESLEDVDLIDVRHQKSKQLSGGMQRRLSIAIALVGNPTIVFLDQPSSGLDPYHKRLIWDILLKCRTKTSIFLTSHLMEEVQILCDRIGIINNGELRCVGTIKNLKQRFANGYRLSISFLNLIKQNENRSSLTEDIIKRFNCQIANELDTRIIFKIDKKYLQDCINMLRNNQDIVWSISQPSFYDVFMHFIK